MAIQGVGAALLLQLERRLTLRADLEASFRPGRPQAGSDFAFGLRLEVATL